MAKLFLRDDLLANLCPKGCEEGAAAPDAATVFATLDELPGEVYRQVARRKTMRIVVGDRPYFAKLHYGVGWSEIFKNLITLKLPVVGASNEFHSCNHLAANDIAAPLVAGFAEEGVNPAEKLSVVVCDALDQHISLEDVVANWHAEPPTVTRKRALIAAVAEFARRFHDAGVIHRDFYICHFLADEPALALDQVSLSVIDLHRAKLFRRIPRRWLKKDLAALLFSVMDLPLTQTDWLRFLKIYTAKPLREALQADGPFWQQVLQRAKNLHRKETSKTLADSAGGPHG